MADACEALAEELVRGAQEAYVAALTERLAEMLGRGVENPDEYAVALGTARQECMAVWAEWRGRVTEGARRAFEEAMAAEDEAVEASLAEAYGERLAEGLTGSAANAAAEAARGLSEMVARQNVALAETAAQAWYRAASEAVVSVQLGGSRREAMERACSELARAGVETVDYRSGRRTSVDAAIRRHVVTQAAQCRADLLERRMRACGHDLVFTSAKWPCRPSHRGWQGRPFCLAGPKVVDGVAYGGLREETGYGTPSGLAGCNCGHRMYPYVPGRTRLPDADFSDRERRLGLSNDEAYAAQQRQRALERAVRAAKREVAVGQSRGLGMADARCRLGRAQARLRAHVAANPHLVRDYGRERAYGVAQQPRALTAAAGAEMRERFIPRDMPARGTAFDVVRKVVNGPAYRGKFDRAGIPKRAAETAYTEARAILRDRDGTDRERMSVVAWSTGHKVTDTFSGPAERGRCALSESQYRAASKAPGGVVLLHNHPMSTRPSFADIRALAENGFVRASLVLGHDGTVWAVSGVRPEVVGRYEELLSEARGGLGGIMSTEEIEMAALDALYEENGGKRWFRLRRM